MKIHLKLTPLSISEDTMNYLKSQTDKFLLLALIGGFISVFLHIMHHQGDVATIQWIEKSVDLTTGALLSLITGQIYKSLTASTTTPDKPDQPSRTEEMLMPAAPTMTSPVVAEAPVEPTKPEPPKE